MANKDAHIAKQRKRETRETDRGTDIKRYSSRSTDLTSKTVHSIHHINWETRVSIGVPVPPIFGLGDTVPPTFHDTGEEFAVIRDDLWRSN